VIKVRFVIDLKLDVEPSLNMQLLSLAAARCAALRLLQQGGRWSVVMNIYAPAGLP